MFEKEVYGLNAGVEKSGLGEALRSITRLRSHGLVSVNNHKMDKTILVRFLF